MSILSEAGIQRYARQIVLPEVGGEGQERLLRARVLIVGAGGLGSPLALYLAAAGVGTLGIVDDDLVEVSNLHRQIAHAASRVGWPKTSSLARAVADIDPEIRLVQHACRLDARNADELVDGYDLVADGSDSFATRALVHDACRRAGRVLVSAAVQGVAGQLTTFKSHLGAPHPCLHCLFPAPPDEGILPNCAAAGVLGPVAGVLGTLQAVEVTKEILSRGDSLSGTLLLYDAMAATLERVRVGRRPGCPQCGDTLATNPRG
ncbi:adenylyltransferase and sulfurtransferase [Arboricoccus pini]|uniref:Molybdopterin-synthase adenylyltransferase n=1 Tax=Arboricoccus pini TaxID=1963835 RepID=A0A212R9T8_9PROT|nr:molybdopterin-synthase adenylyltransferase MoeB [Arboricoccus pini]SNB68961.1 adenylyltransferase and sulfurtransferase [Arboricoccus pini]